MNYEANGGKKSETPDVLDGAIPPLEVKKRKREKAAIIILGLFFCLLTYLEIHLSNLSQSLPFVNSIFFFGLVNFNVALLLFLSFLIFRNGVKVFSESRGGLLGSSLKSKLVMAFVFFAFVPTILLFLISVFYINSSFDKWFSLRIGNVLNDSLEVTNTYFTSTKKKNYHFAHRAAEGLKGLRSGSRLSFLKEFRQNNSLDVVEFYPSLLGKREVFTSPELAAKEMLPVTLEFLKKGVNLGVEASTIHQFAGGNLIRCIVPVRGGSGRLVGAVVVSTFIPISIISKMDDIALAYEGYRDVNPLKYPIKSIYLIILALVTLTIFFGATWFGFHLARQFTHPLEILGKTTKEIVHGKYRPVHVQTGSQEVHQLVNNFNKMIEALSISEQALKTHSRYIEVILSNVSAGVISVDDKGVIRTVNKYAANLLGIKPEIILGKHYSDVLSQEHQIMISDLIGKLVKHRAHSIQKEILVNVRGENLTLQATLSPLKDDFGGDLGFVVLVDDLTKLINAQRASAWREVARRIAHEIKNPLTPIQLSAERLQKKFGEAIQDHAFSTCTQTIITQVEELKGLVNEFSSFARMPQARLSLNNLNETIAESLVLFKEAHKDIKFVTKSDEALPNFDFDREQIKRLLVNLVDNSISAIHLSDNGKNGLIEVSSFYDSGLKLVRITLIDNGPGIPAEIKDKIFDPYFSTKAGGTGLGLAIVKRIIDDHNGFIRVFNNHPVGSKFIIELPVIRRQTTNTVVENISSTGDFAET